MVFLTISAPFFGQSDGERCRLRVFFRLGTACPVFLKIAPRSAERGAKSIEDFLSSRMNFSDVDAESANFICYSFFENLSRDVDIYCLKIEIFGLK